MGNPLISGKSRLVKYYNLARLYATYHLLREPETTIDGKEQAITTLHHHVGEYFFYFFQCTEQANTLGLPPTQ